MNNNLQNMLYLIEDREYIKIGYAANIEKRLATYTLHNCYYSLIKTRKGSITDEKNIHSLCDKYRYKGEWYYNVPEVIEIFDTYQSNLIVNWKKAATKLNTIGHCIDKLYKSSINFPEFKYKINRYKETIQNDLKFIKTYLNIKLKNDGIEIDSYRELLTNILKLCDSIYIKTGEYKIARDTILHIDNPYFIYKEDNPNYYTDWFWQEYNKYIPAPTFTEVIANVLTTNIPYK